MISEPKLIIDFITNLNWELVIAAMALIISTIGMFSSRKLNRELGEQQLLINELQITREKQQIEEQGKADFRAFVTGSNGKYSLHISNQGEDAKNVMIEILIDQEYKNSFFDLDSVFPINLNKGQKATIRYSRGYNFPSKFKIQLTWDDKNQKNSSKEIDIA